MAGKGCSRIFIGSELPPVSDKDWKSTRHSFVKTAKRYLSVSPSELPFRVLASFVPPFIGEHFQPVNVDFVGPSLALLLLTGLLHYGHAYKLPAATAGISPSEAVLLYTTLMSPMAFVLTRLGRAEISFPELISLLGYGLWGHIFTLLTSLLFYQEKSNVFFFFCLTIFGGLSALRVAMVLLFCITVPAARLLVGSLIAVTQLLFLVFLHFAYMHKTFVYGASATSHLQVQ